MSLDIAMTGIKLRKCQKTISVLGKINNPITGTVYMARPVSIPRRSRVDFSGFGPSVPGEETADLTGTLPVQRRFDVDTRRGFGVWMVRGRTTGTLEVPPGPLEVLAFGQLSTAAANPRGEPSDQ